MRMGLASGTTTPHPARDAAGTDGDNGELLCRVTPVHGKGDAVYDEAGYLYLPPCQWSSHDPRLPKPPVLRLDGKLRMVKRSNSSVGHYGVMGIWQMRGAYGA